MSNTDYAVRCFHFYDGSLYFDARSRKARSANTAEEITREARKPYWKRGNEMWDYIRDDGLYNVTYEFDNISKSQATARKKMLIEWYRNKGRTVRNMRD